MHLKALSLVNYKNIGSLALEFSGKINCFVGDNGTGKTNILDSVYFLSFTKSYFNPAESNNIRHGEKFAMIEGVYDTDSGTDTVVMGLQRGSKKSVKRNGKEPERLSDYIGQYPLVIISPSDSDLISEGSGQRRKFIDGVISQTDKQFLQDLLRYGRTLEQRNALLKYFSAGNPTDPTQIDVYDEILMEAGRRIYERRRDFLEVFTPIFRELYSSVSQGREEAHIELNSDLSDVDFAQKYRDARPRDIQTGFTMMGVHKDDLKLLLGGYPVKKFGSQGQQKTFLTALKLAQFHFMQQKSGVKPILLLDDIFDKLDTSRVDYIIKLVKENTFGQVFISDTHPERVRALIENNNVESKIFDMGAIK